MMGCILNTEKFTLLPYTTIWFEGYDERLKKHVIVLFQEMLVQKWNWSIFLRQFGKDFSSLTELFPYFLFAVFCSFIKRGLICLVKSDLFEIDSKGRKKTFTLHVNFQAHCFSQIRFQRNRETGTTFYSYC